MSQIQAASQGPCPEVANELTRELGGFDCSGSPVVEFRNPADLTHWTMPLLEVLILAGAVLALWYAVRRLRRHGDPTNLALMIGGLAYLTINEPPLYFPNKFGLMEQVGLNFVHNVFIVQFMWDRLPLYISALYIALPMLAYEAVRVTGVFRRYGLLPGALAVGFVHSAFYEIFDTIGPQLSWWKWNHDAPSNSVFLDAVPVGSITLYSAVSIAGLALGLGLFVGRQTWAGNAPRGRSLVWRTAAVGATALVVMLAVGALESVVRGLGGGDGAYAVVLYLELAIVWVGGALALGASWLAGRREGTAVSSVYSRVYGWSSLAAFPFFWAVSIPSRLDAVDGVTPQGPELGNLPFVLLCFAAATFVTLVAGHGGPLEDEDAQDTGERGSRVDPVGSATQA